MRRLRLVGRQVRRAVAQGTVALLSLGVVLLLVDWVVAPPSSFALTLSEHASIPGVADAVVYGRVTGPTGAGLGGATITLKGVASNAIGFYGSTGSLHLNSPIVGMAVTPSGDGYWIVAQDGGIFAFGDAPFEGSVPQVAPVDNIVGMVVDDKTGGYWIVGSDGSVWDFNVPQYGDLPVFGVHRSNIVGAAATPDDGGLYVVGSDGAVYSLVGDAHVQGSMAGKALNAPIVGMTVDPKTGGYWLLGRDGGVFSFGAPFFGSTGNIVLNKPVVGMVSTPDGGGYWFDASDGGVFAYGDAVFHGSTGSIHLNQPVVGMTPTELGDGYWLVAADGGIFSFGNEALSATTSTAADGTYAIDPPNGVYTETISLVYNRSTLLQSTTFVLSGGSAYDVSAQVNTAGTGFFFSPITSY